MTKGPAPYCCVPREGSPGSAVEVSTASKLLVSIDAAGAGVPILYAEAAADVPVAVVAVVWSLGFRVAVRAEEAAEVSAAISSLATVSISRGLLGVAAVAVPAVLVVVAVVGAAFDGLAGISSARRRA